MIMHSCIPSSQSLSFHYCPLLTMKNRLSLSCLHSSVFVLKCVCVCGCILYIQFYSYPPVQKERACV